MGGTGRYVAVTYSKHAREQMAERLISPRQIERTIAAPNRTRPSTNPLGRTVAERETAAGNTLRVVYAEVPTLAGVTAHVVTIIRIGRKRT